MSEEQVFNKTDETIERKFGGIGWVDLAKACQQKGEDGSQARAELDARIAAMVKVDLYAIETKPPETIDIAQTLEAAAKAGSDEKARETIKSHLVTSVPAHSAWPFDKALPVTEFLVDDMIPLGEYGHLTGIGGGGKTKFAIMIALGVVTGGGPQHSWLPFTVDNDCVGGIGVQGNVVFVSWEDRYDEILRRIGWMSQQPGMEHVSPAAIKDKLIFLDARRIGSLWAPVKKGGHTSTIGRLQEAGKTVRAVAEKYDARLLVIDPLAAAFSLNENDRSLVRMFISDHAGWATDHRCTVLIISHPPKSGAKFSGSTDWHSGSRFMLCLEKTNDTGYVIDSFGNVILKPSDAKRGQFAPAPASKITLEKSSYSRPGRNTWLRYTGRAASWEQCSAEEAARDEHERFVNPGFSGAYGYDGKSRPHPPQQSEPEPKPDPPNAADIKEALGFD